MLGGVPTPAVGWAMGVERLASLIPDFENAKINYFIVSQDAKAAFELSEKLWKKNLSVDFDFSARKFAKQLEKASKTAKYAIILGEDEIKGNFLTVKNLETGEQTKKKFEEL
jgi:histidyl-tRNA synthetase